MSVWSVPGASGVVDGTKPISGEVVWGEAGRGGGPAGSTTGAGAAPALAWSFSRARRARSRARRVASMRYWSLEKELGLQVMDMPRGNFSGSRYLSSFWYRQVWVSARSRRRRVHRSEEHTSELQ